jgi:cyclic pyranopterin phosphate synthase
MTMGDKLTHIDADGRARMVDVSGKPATKRIATAEGRVLMSGKALDLARSKGGKGDVRATAEIAGVMAAKRTSDLIPMCHPLALSNVKVRVNELEDTHPRRRPGSRLCAKGFGALRALCV